MGAQEIDDNPKSKHFQDYASGASCKTLKASGIFFGRWGKKSAMGTAIAGIMGGLETPWNAQDECNATPDDHARWQDRAALRAFYDFPAEHGVHIRTTNPIESSFVTIRHRTTRTKNCISRNTLLGLIFQLALTAEKRWRTLGASSSCPRWRKGFDLRMA